MTTSTEAATSITLPQPDLSTEAFLRLPLLFRLPTTKAPPLLPSMVAETDLGLLLFGGGSPKSISLEEEVVTTGGSTKVTWLGLFLREPAPA